MSKKSSLPDLYVTALSTALERRRKDLCMSQDELAEKAGLHRTYVSLIERKSCNFSIKIFMRLAFALDTEPAELMKTAEELANSGKVKPTVRNENHNAQPRPRMAM
jgi:transcriptional regulator with XRE-family HTH domain